MDSSELVDKPDHYEGTGCLDSMALVGLETGYCLSSAFKYLWRLGKKVNPGESQIDAARRDLAKVRWCLNRADSSKNHTVEESYLLNAMGHIADRSDEELEKGKVRSNVKELRELGTRLLDIKRR